jgi:hypothetical protein
MKTISIKLIIFVLFISSTKVFADDFSEALLETKKELDAAFNRSDLPELKKVRGKFERLHQLKKDPWLVDYYIALTDYRIAISNLGGGNKDEIKKYTLAGIESIDKSISAKDDFADAYVLKLALGFNRWQFEAEKMNEIIAFTGEAEDNASYADKNNPRLYLLKGISLFYTPAAFGGGADPAITQLDKSQNLFETVKPVNDLYPDWGEDWVYGYKVLALVQRNKDGDISKARELLNIAQEKFPESGFITNVVVEEFNKATEVN